MRSFRFVLTFSALTLVILTASHYYALRQAPAQVAAAGPTGSASNGTGQTYSLYCGLWRIDTGFTSTIHIKNVLTIGPLTVTPVLFTADGTEYDLPPVRLATAGSYNVRVNEALVNAPASITSHLSQYGSVALRYQYKNPGHVVASMDISNLRQSLVFSVPFSAVDERRLGVQTIEGAWWRHSLDVKGFVALTNVTADPIEVSLRPTGSQGTPVAGLTSNIRAHSTQMFDLDSLVEGLSDAENQAGGLRFQYNGKRGSIVATGGLLHEQSGYSADMQFWQHDLGSTAPPSRMTLASVGLMIGQPDPMMGFPATVNFTP